MYDWANSTFAQHRGDAVPGPVSDGARESSRRPGRARPSAGYSGGSAVVVGLPDLDFRGHADLRAADCGNHRRFQPEQEAIDGPVRLHRRAGDGRDVLSARRRVSRWRSSVPDREPGVRGVHRGLQLVPARHRASRAARRGVVHRLGHRIFGRRLAAGAEPGAVHQGQSAGALRIHGGADQSRVGGRLVGALQPDSAGRHPQSSAGPKARSGRRAAEDLPRIRGDSARHAPLSADAAISDRLPALQRRRAGRDRAVRAVRQRRAENVRWPT